MQYWRSCVHQVMPVLSGAVSIKTPGAFMAALSAVYHCALSNCCAVTVRVLVPAAEHVCLPGLQFIHLL